MHHAFMVNLKAIWLCGGDLNACVGAANRSKVTLADRQLWKHYRKPVGQYGLARRTAAGDMFLDWLSSANLCLGESWETSRSEGYSPEELRPGWPLIG